MARLDWHRLLPLIAQVQAQCPDVALSAVLTEQVASARHLPGVLAWRLWRLLHQSRQQETRPKKLPSQHTQPEHVEKSKDWHQHLTAVRTIGGPAAVRAALHTAQPHSTDRQRKQ